MPYLTGAPFTGYVMRLIRIPTDTSFLIAVNGAILELASERNWETFGSMTAKEAADAAFVMWSEYMNSSLVGQVFAHMLPDAPQGALNCDGQIVPRALYPRLYDAISPVFRLGHDHIKLPDLRGRMVRGASLGDLGLTGGSETVTLTENEMPTHTHSALPHAHATTIPVSAVINGGLEAPASASIPISGMTAYADIDIAASGGGQPHENMPPYLCLTWAVWAE